MKILYQFHFIKLVRQGVREMKKACVKQAFFMILSYSMFFLTWVRYSFIFMESLRSIISRRDDNCFCIPRTWSGVLGLKRIWLAGSRLPKVAPLLCPYVF